MRNDGTGVLVQVTGNTPDLASFSFVRGTTQFLVNYIAGEGLERIEMFVTPDADLDHGTFPNPYDEHGKLVRGPIQCLVQKQS
jgi:hypothetical protein